MYGGNGSKTAENGHEQSGQGCSGNDVGFVVRCVLAEELNERKDAGGSVQFSKTNRRTFRVLTEQKHGRDVTEPTKRFVVRVLDLPLDVYNSYGPFVRRGNFVRERSRRRRKYTYAVGFTKC